MDRQDWPAAKALWKEAFGDSDSFIEKYFETRIAKGISIGLFLQGELASMLFLMPCRMNIRGRENNVAFLAGAATAQKHRKKGLMRKALGYALEILRERGIASVYLYPFLHAFYEQFGWQTYTGMSAYQLSDARVEGEYRFAKPNVGEMLALYRQMMQPYSGYIVREQDMMSGRIKTHLTEGKVLGIYGRDELRAYLLYGWDGEKAIIEEAVGADLYALSAGAQQIRQEMGSELELPLPPDKKLNKALFRQVRQLPYAMGRVVALKEFFARLGHST